MFDLLDYCKALTLDLQEKGLSSEASPSSKAEEYDTKAAQVRSGFTHIENIVEGFANGMSKQLNETHTQNMQIERDRDELSKSL